jgi:hypothetical protein
MKVSRRDFKREILDDPYPDLSWLESYYDTESQTITTSHRYSNKDIAQYGFEQVKAWIDQDMDYLNDYGNAWYMQGVRASVQLKIPCESGFIQQTIYSPGDWGIESTAPRDCFDDAYQDQCYYLVEILEYMGLKVVE